MRVLEDFEIILAKKYFKEAREIAMKSPCYEKFGAVMVKDNILLSKGFNFSFKDKEFDIPAEEGVILEAIKTFNPLFIADSTIYLAKLNFQNKIVQMGKYLSKNTSKLALDNKLKEWVLFHEFGFCAYSAQEYYELSFGLTDWKPMGL